MPTPARQSGGRRRRRRRRPRSERQSGRASAADGVPPAAAGPARQLRVVRRQQLRVGSLHGRQRHATAAPGGLPLRCHRHPPPPPQGGGSANAAALPGLRQQWVIKPSSLKVWKVRGDGGASAATGVELPQKGARRSGGAAQRGGACPTTPLAFRGGGRADRGSSGNGGDLSRPGGAGAQGSVGQNTGTIKGRQSRLHGERGDRGRTRRARAPTAVQAKKRCQQAPQTTLPWSAQTCRRVGGVSAGEGGREARGSGGGAGMRLLWGYVYQNGLVPGPSRL